MNPKTPVSSSVLVRFGRWVHGRWTAGQYPAGTTYTQYMRDELRRNGQQLAALGIRTYNAFINRLLLAVAAVIIGLLYVGAHSAYLALRHTLGF